MVGWMRLSNPLGLLLLVWAVKAADRKFRFYIDDYIVKTVAKDLIDVFNCKLTQIPTRSFLNCNVRVKHNIYDLELESTQDMRLRNNQKRQVFISGVFTRDTTHWQTVWPESLIQMDNFQCLNIINFFKNNTSRTITNWYLQSSIPPSYVPESRLRAFTKYISKKRHILSHTFIAKIILNNKFEPSTIYMQILKYTFVAVAIIIIIYSISY